MIDSVVLGFCVCVVVSMFTFYVARFGFVVDVVSVLNFFCMFLKLFV